MHSMLTLQHELPTTNPRVVNFDADVQEVLDVLADGESRSILEVTAMDSLTATQISNICGLPLSTTYRKLGELTNTGLLGERTRVPRSGVHSREYSCLVENIVIATTDDWGIEVHLPRRDEPYSTIMGPTRSDSDD